MNYGNYNGYGCDYGNNYPYRSDTYGYGGTGLAVDRGYGYSGYDDRCERAYNAGKCTGYGLGILALIGIGYTVYKELWGGSK